MYVNKNLSQAGFLAFSSAVVWNGELNKVNPSAPDVNDYTVGDRTLMAAPKFWLTNQAACEAIMTPFSSAGVGVYAPDPEPGYAETFPRMAVILATPFDADSLLSYRTRMFGEVNRLRARGINSSSYPGALCTSGPVPLLKWNDKMAQAAQVHSDDYAAQGVVSGRDGSPHTGTAGEAPNSRIQAAGCTAGGGENVNFNFGLSPEDAVRSWITMSAGHCSNIFSTQATVAGFGIAGSTRLQDSNIGPFVTFNLGVDTGCSAATKIDPNAASGMTISYQAFVNNAWQRDIAAGRILGSGEQGPIEALKIRLTNQAAGCRVGYQVYVQGSDWQAEVFDGAAAGTAGQGKKVEALKVRLVGCHYLAHVTYIAWAGGSSGNGWQPEAADGAPIGSIGVGKPLANLMLKLPTAKK